jgi:hypothetical protein
MLHGHLLYCPNCDKCTVKVSVDQNLLKDTYIIRAWCLCCNAYNVMEITSLSLESGGTSLFKQFVYETVNRLRELEIDLDAIIDKDWELAGG